MKKIIVLALVLGLVGTANAVTRTWTGAGQNGNWNGTANWTTGKVPSAADSLSIFPIGGSSYAPVVTSGNPAVGGDLTIGKQGVSSNIGLTVQGTSLTITNFMLVGAKAGSKGTLTITGGTVTVNGSANNLAGLKIGGSNNDTGDGLGTVNLNGGMLKVKQLYISTFSQNNPNNNGTASKLNITAGILKIVKTNLLSGAAWTAYKTTLETMEGLTGYGHASNHLIYTYDDTNHIATVTASVTAVPEPATIAMLGLGALMLIRRKKN